MMAAVDNVMTSLSSLNALAGKISPQVNSEDNTSPRTNRRVMNNVHREPDPDAIKMFVGQIPRTMGENDLKKMFEEFGEVYQINVLRDKNTGQSRSCCFVTFYTRKAALAAQNELHNIKTLAGMHHPIQMKPADTENKNERKLFIGMLNKRYSEEDVRHMFGVHGAIEDCTVLRDSNGQSKGCAFITFSARQCAITAIKKMHHSQTSEGCSSPLVVKFADTQKEKDAKRLQQATQNFWNLSSTNNMATLNPQYLALLQQQIANSANVNTVGSLNNQLTGSMQPLPNLNNLTMQQLLAASQANLPTQQIFDSPGKLGPGLNSLGQLSSLNLPTSSNGNPDTNLQGLLASMSSQNTGLGMNVQNLAALASMATGNTQTLPSLTQPVIGLPPLSPGEYTWSTGSGFATPSLPSIGGGASSANASSTKQMEGPDGANLFIYHLPQEFTDTELAQTFWPFGKVLSAKVFIDKQTSLSKCFGFVSYENAVDAQRAISVMNGHPIGNKRLKVQLKRSKEQNKPY